MIFVKYTLFLFGLLSIVAAAPGSGQNPNQKSGPFIVDGSGQNRKPNSGPFIVDGSRQNPKPNSEPLLVDGSRQNRKPNSEPLIVDGSRQKQESLDGSNKHFVQGAHGHLMPQIHDLPPRTFIFGALYTLDTDALPEHMRKPGVKILPVIYLSPAADDNKIRVLPLSFSPYGSQGHLHGWIPATRYFGQDASFTYDSGSSRLKLELNKCLINLMNILEVYKTGIRHEEELKMGHEFLLMFKKDLETRGHDTSMIKLSRRRRI